ncbi:hypothetical protein EV360DRAFT_85256 [Lentinula raphanica]|nr:hypothetical protein EV360DRAFT_85256 [Lentinula raphanica]
MSLQSSNMLPTVLILEQPTCGYEYAEIATVLHNKIMLYSNAPHGYYITPNSPDGVQHLFKFANGQDAVKAYLDSFQTQQSPNMLSKHSKSRLPSYPTSLGAVNPRFNPMPMRTGQQSYSSTSEINYMPWMQSASRMAAPDNVPSNMSPNTGASYSRQSDNNALLPLDDIVIADNMLPAARKAHYYVVAHVNDRYSRLDYLDFHLPIDTGSYDSFLFGEGFKYLDSENKSVKFPPVTEWPEDFQKGLSHIRWPHVVNHSKLLNFNIPKKNLTFGHTGHVEIQHGPVNSGVNVTLYGWDWYRGNHSEQGFTVVDGFNFATASSKRIVLENYDGNIGLAPKLNPERDTYRNFLAALTAYRYVENASVFYIRLVHPKVAEKVGQDSDLVVSFGPYYPFKVPSDPEENFSLPIPTVGHSPQHWPEYWKVRLLRIGITSTGPGPSSNYSWINMDSSSSSTNQGVIIHMDTGSPMSVLPDYVVSNMLSDNNWLGSGSLDISHATYTKLNQQTICFEFQGEGTNPVSVHVSANMFLLWYPTRGDHHRDPFYHCAIKGAQARYSLGQNWFWAALVKHVIPQRGRRVPYVQAMANGGFYDKKGNMKLL